MTDSMTEPKLSIVVPVYNGKQYIRHTLASLETIEKKISCELIFQNGQSTDGTTEILDSFCLNHVTRRHCNEPDQGQSDAINKGVAKACGKWVTWICADDILLPALEGAIREAEEAEAQVVYGDVIFMNGSVLSPAAGTESYQPGILAKRRLVIQQPGTCVLRNTWNAFNGVRHDLNWVMDYDLFLRMESAGTQFLRVEDFLAAIRIHPDAKTSSGSMRRMLELWGILWQSHKRKPVYFRIRPYIVYCLEYIIKYCESCRNKGWIFPPRLLLSLLHRIFWIIAVPGERKQIEKRFAELPADLTTLLSGTVTKR